MHITIAIPTRNRSAKLIHTIRSIPVYDWLDILIGVDNEHETVKSMPEDIKSRVTLYEYHQKGDAPFGSVYIRNKLMEHVPAAMMYAVDDIEFQPGSIEAARDAMLEHFPDGDGLIGFWQSCIGFLAWGLALAGKKFIDGYPNRWLFCPDYFHFGDYEIGRLAQLTGRFYFCNAAKIVHFHPTAGGNVLVDQTHMDARKKQRADTLLCYNRKAKGLIWGMAPPVFQEVL